MPFIFKCIVHDAIAEPPDLVQIFADTRGEMFGIFVDGVSDKSVDDVLLQIDL